jgi:hypothetical protein
MPLTRQQLRHQAAIARYQAGRHKPPTRKQMQAWLDPIRKAMAEIRTGEVDAYRGYPITRIHHADNDFARVDFAINGFLALITRLMPDCDVTPLQRLSKKLENGVLLSLDEVTECGVLLNAIEDKLLTFTRAQLKDAADLEMIIIELERLDIKEAA